MATITITNVFKRYGDGFPAVNDISLDVEDGELMILVGPSGCGKSTLLRMIAGLEDISDGEIAIDGKRVNERSPRDRNLAMVFQNYALYPHLSVFENIAFPLRLRKDLPEEEIRKRVETAAGTLELTEHLQRKPGQLSGGQRQRVAMGRAIVRSVDAFLFDEPLSNLDAKLRGQMRTEIHRLQRRMGTTTVYVTHDQTEAMTLGDRVAVLRKGVLQQCATPRELYENPVNLFVAGFIGSPPMNFLPATVEGNVLRTPLADVELSPDATRAVGDRTSVVLGIRPEQVEDLAMVDPAHKAGGTTFTAHVDVTEWLGDRKYAYLPYEAGHVEELEAELAQLEQELDGERLRSQFVVALDPSSGVNEGAEAELWLDRSRMLIFDPHTGDNITRPVAAGGDGARRPAGAETPVSG